MSEYKKTWQVGDMAWIHTDDSGLSRGDMVKVTGVRVDGSPVRGCGGSGYMITNVYRVLRKGEKVPDGTVLVRVGNYWKDSYSPNRKEGTEAVVGKDINGSSGGLWAIKSIPTVDPERAERLKRIENMERELAELKKLEEDR